jgi:hypothetical protein
VEVLDFLSLSCACILGNDFLTDLCKAWLDFANHQFNLAFKPMGEYDFQLTGFL